MTTNADGPRGPDPSGKTPPSASAARRFFADARVGAKEAASASAPVLKGAAARLGDWLATVGWGKFFIVAVLLMIFGGIATSIISGDERAIVVHPSTDQVQVDIHVGSDGTQHNGSVLSFE